MKCFCQITNDVLTVPVLVSTIIMGTGTVSTQKRLY